MCTYIHICVCIFVFRELLVNIYQLTPVCIYIKIMHWYKLKAKEHYVNKDISEEKLE